MLTLVVFFFLLLRWRILEPLIGTVYMYLFDAVMFILLAALNFAQAGTGWIQWFSYAVGGLCIFWSFQAARKYVKFDEQARKANEHGKSDSGPTAGS